MNTDAFHARLRGKKIRFDIGDKYVLWCGGTKIFECDYAMIAVTLTTMYNSTYNTSIVWAYTDTTTRVHKLSKARVSKFEAIRVQKPDDLETLMARVAVANGFEYSIGVNMGNSDMMLRQIAMKNAVWYDD